MITAEQLIKIAGGRPPKANINSVITALEKYGPRAGLHYEHRLAHYIAQLATESGGFRYDREIWGPTKAQQRYDVGKKALELGNTPEPDGDGRKYAGYGPMQVTGRGNVSRFYKWCLSAGLNPPDFVKDPSLIVTDPWEGLSAIWYWDSGNPTGKSLNAYADENNIVQITKRVNGGLNGFDERVRYYVRAALVLLGYDPADVKGFQKWAQHQGLLPADTKGKPQVDGDAGPLTMAALHRALAAKAGVAAGVKPSPVTVEKVVVEKQKVEVPVEVPVVPEGADKSHSTWFMGLVDIISPAISAFADLDPVTKMVFGGIGILAIAFLIWRGELIARRIKSVVAEFSR